MNEIFLKGLRERRLNPFVGLRAKKSGRATRFDQLPVVPKDGDEKQRRLSSRTTSTAAAIWIYPKLICRLRSPSAAFRSCPFGSLPPSFSAAKKNGNDDQRVDSLQRRPKGSALSDACSNGIEWPVERV